MIANPMIGSARGKPIATTIADAITPSDTNPSTRACCPSAIRAGLFNRSPARSRTRARELVPHEADHARERERNEIVQLAGMDEAFDRLQSRHGRARRR